MIFRFNFIKYNEKFLKIEETKRKEMKVLKATDQTHIYIYIFIIIV